MKKFCFVAILFIFIWPLGFAEPIAFEGKVFETTQQGIATENGSFMQINPSNGEEFVYTRASNIAIRDNGMLHFKYEASQTDFLGFFPFIEFTNTGVGRGLLVELDFARNKINFYRKDLTRYEEIPIDNRCTFSSLKKSGYIETRYRFNGTRHIVTVNVNGNTCSMEIGGFENIQNAVGFRAFPNRPFNVKEIIFFEDNNNRYCKSDSQNSINCAEGEKFAVPGVDGKVVLVEVIEESEDPGDKFVILDTYTYSGVTRSSVTVREGDYLNEILTEFFGGELLRDEIIVRNINSGIVNFDILPTGLVGYWDFEGNNPEERRTDKTKNNNNLNHTYENGDPLQYTNTPFGQGLTFNKQTAKIINNNHTLSNLEEFTITFWAKKMETTTAE